MKRLILVLFLVVLVSCSNAIAPENNNEELQENNIENDEREKSDVSISFSEVEVVARNKSLSVTGEAKSNVDEFYYILEQGDETIIDETVVELEGEGNADEWRLFSIEDKSLEIDEDNDEAPYLTFYVKDDDRMINPNYVPIDLLLY